MAPIQTTLAMSHVEGVSDSARARELYKYYQPNAPVETSFPTGPPPSEATSDADELRDINVKSNITSSKISSPDTALTSFCQLVTWRTGAQRAMISLIDAETQYFIAESTKTVDLVDNTKFGPGDEIWMGCGSVRKNGRLCERTIAVSPTNSGDCPCFVVNDLTKDDRFNQLPFVTGTPFLRFYAGVPLITKRGIPIGSLFIVDDRVRHGLEQDHSRFMGTMAKTIMKHLEMVREVEEHRRGMKMSRGLASFVEGRAELVEAEIEAEDGEGTKIAGQFETGHGITRTKSKGSTRESVKSSVASAASLERKAKEYSAELVKTEEAIMEHTQQDSQSTRPDLESASQPTSFGCTSVSVSSPQDGQDLLDKTGSTPGDGDEMSEGSTMRVVFSRAANLTREAFEVDGCVFYDAQRGFSSDLHRKSEGSHPLFHHDSHQESQTSGDELQSSGEQVPENVEVKSQYLPQTRGDSPGLGEGGYSRTSIDSKKPVEVLGFSTADASSIHGDTLPGPQSFKPFEEKALHTLLQRYPRGKLWTFDSDGAVSSSSEGELHKPRQKDPIEQSKELHRRKARNKSDAKFLSTHFPGVRQLLFVPLWDAGRSRWLSGCFAWSTDPTRVLSKQNELAFLTAFGNSVMAENSRIDTEIADQKKGDFIGSISHELRSPLHGILASAEFLGEEVDSTFEKSMVETIDSCGRTLLDTINHILDFSKINHFEKNWRKIRRGGTRSAPRSTGGPLALRKADLPMINLFAEVDVSLVCEEVVEGVFAGHVFQHVTAQSFDMVPHARGKMAESRKFSLSEEMMGKENLQHPEVTVILDVDIQNYNFTTQPGAFRRVIMNLLGNALKYTSHGYVRIKLDATEMEDLQIPGSGDAIARSMVTLTITDTGRGISGEFLRSKLFTPFAQENSLSSGTGLGLSIVRSIVALLEGDITIDSEVGRGTQVRVTLPLLREMPKTADSASSNTKSIASILRESDESISTLRNRVIGRRVSLHGFDLNTVDPVINKMGQLLKSSVTNFLTNWYGLQVVPLGQKTSIIISNEANPETILKLARQAATIHRNNPAIVVLCSHSSRFDRNVSPSDSKYKVGFIAKPVGPLKLAKAIIACLEGTLPLPTPGLQQDGPASIAESNDLSNVFEELSMSRHGTELLDNSRMAVDSDNARKAIESPTPNAQTEKNVEFPFPTVDDRPPASKMHSMPADKESLVSVTGSTKSHPASIVLASMGKAALTLPLASPRASARHRPSLLLVDDNQINLSLLTTYMERKNYDIVHKAENGLEAVNKFKEREDGYDIVFMDISMPILNGFEATREIRAIERSRRERSSNPLLEESTASFVTANSIKSPPEQSESSKAAALVIAITGLASNRDQTEAAASGVDLFLTKPVMLKEVGKMLENWEANRERDSRGSGSSEA